MNELLSKLTKNSLIVWSLMFVLGFIYLMLGIGHEALWFDESYSAAITNYSIPEIVSIAAYDSHPPLYYIILKIITLIFGKSEVSLRLLSVLGTLAFVSLGIGPIKRIYGRFTGTIFSLLVLSAPMVLSMGQEARMYTWSAFFVTGCVLYGYLGVKENKTWDWVRFSLFTVSSAYTHYFALLAVTIANVLLFVWILTADRKSLKQYIFAALGSLAGFLPWMTTLYNQVSMTAKEFWIPPVGIDVIREALLFPYKAKFETIPSAYICFIGAVVIIVLGITTSIKKKQDIKLPAYALLTYTLTLLTAIVLSNVVRPLFVERYIFPSIGLLLLAVTIFISTIKNRKFTIVILAVFVLLSIPQIYRIITQNYNGPMKEVSASLIADVKKDDIFVHTSVHTYGTFIYYFPDNKHLYYLPYEPINKSGNDAFNNNGEVVSDIYEAVKSHKNIWMVDQIGGVGTSDSYGWYDSGLFKIKKAPIQFKLSNSWFQVTVAPVEVGEIKEEAPVPEGNGNIKLKIWNIRDNSGKLAVRLFKKCDLLFTMSGEFEDTCLLEMKTIETNGSEAEVVFENIPYGYYTGFTLQDLNGNNQLDYTGNYIPTEGIGMTNGMEKFMDGGIPTFEAGKFLLDKEEIEVKLDLVYFD